MVWLLLFINCIFICIRFFRVLVELEGENVIKKLYLLVFVLIFLVVIVNLVKVVGGVDNLVCCNKFWL